MGKGVILDPFMGSGSTIAAASACGLESTGLETNREFFEMAEKAIPQLAGTCIPGADSGGSEG